METQVVKFNVTDSAIAEMKTAYMGLIITNLNSQKQFDAVHSARMIVKGKRVEVEKRRKELKADALAWGKKVQTEANRIFALIEPIETHLNKEEKKVIDEKVRKEDARIAAINERIAGFSDPYNALKGMGTVEQLKAIILDLYAIPIQPDEFFEFTAEANKIHSDLIETVKQALSSLQHFEQRKADQKKEDERLAAERKKQAEVTAKQKVVQDKMDTMKRKFEEEKAELEREKKADQERRDREEFECQAKEKAEKEAKEKAERKEHERIERTKANAIENERQAALRPDKDKIVDYANDLMNLRRPPVESVEAKQLMGWALTQLTLLSDSIKNRCENL